MYVSPFSAVFSCSATCAGFVLLPEGKARTNLARLVWGLLEAKWMLAMPAEDSIRAKLFSAAADSSGVPSSSNWSPETARRRPDRSSEPRAVRSSLQAVSYCLTVRGWPKSYILANLSRMLRLRSEERRVGKEGK